MRLGNTVDMFMNDSEMTAGVMCMTLNVITQLYFLCVQIIEDAECPLMHLKTISALEERAMNTILNSIIIYLQTLVRHWSYFRYGSLNNESLVKEYHKM